MPTNCQPTKVRSIEYGQKPWLLHRQERPRCKETEKNTCRTDDRRPKCQPRHDEKHGTKNYQKDVQGARHPCLFQSFSEIIPQQASSQNANQSKTGAQCGNNLGISSGNSTTHVSFVLRGDFEQLSFLVIPWTWFGNKTKGVEKCRQQ